MFGKLMNATVRGKGVSLNYDFNTIKVDAIRSNIIRIYEDKRSYEHSYAVTDKMKHVTLQIKDIAKQIQLETEKLNIEVYDEGCFRIYDKCGNLLCRDQQTARKEHQVHVVKHMEGDEFFYGLGDKPGFLNKKYYAYEMWNSDIPDPHVESHKSLYKSIPFFITLRKETMFGLFFDSSYRSNFQMGSANDDSYSYYCDDGYLDYYFIHGKTIYEILEGYTLLTGTFSIPPLWSLGYHQSRWSYETEDEVREIVSKLKEYDIPCSALHLDIDFMNGCRVFTYDNNKFPQFANLIQDLKSKGIHIVTIVDPGVKKDELYHIYKSGHENDFYLKTIEGDEYTNWVWPGTVVFPDFSKQDVRKWWGNNHKIYTDLGVEGIWNDMNEPSTFHGEIPEDIVFYDEGTVSKHNKIHNVYGHLMAKATYEGLKDITNLRPFVITRACYAGTQKYATAWTGDNHSIWAHLQMSIPQICNLGMSGMAFVGVDIGGFGSDCTKELLCRWVQANCFFPLFRNHSIKGSRRQEPWTFDEQTLQINRTYIQLRYHFIPYLYDLLWEHMNTGHPVIRPLFMDYTEDSNTYELNDQYLVGRSIMVAPVVMQGAVKRMVYFPDDQWIDYWTKEEIKQKGFHIVDAPIDICPIYVKKGSIIPFFKEKNFDLKETDTLCLEIYSGKGELMHYQDNGTDFQYLDGQYSSYKIRLEGYTLIFDIVHNQDKKNYKNIILRYCGKDIQIKCEQFPISINLAEFT